MRPIEHYHELLAAGDPLAEWEQFREAMAARNLRFRERYVCNVLRPAFVTRDRYARLAGAATAFLQALRRVNTVLMAEPELRRRIGLTADEERVVLLDPGFPSPDGFTRLDGFLDETGDLRFIEYNAESPGGLAFADALSDIFEQLPTFQRFAAATSVSRFQTRTSLLETLLAHYRQWGGRGTPTIAIVDWRSGVGTAPEFVLCQQSFEAAGVPTLISSPEALELRGGRLLDGESGRAVDLVYKRAVTGELLERLGPDNILARAVHSRAACMVNSFRNQMLFKKAVFALMSEWLDAGRFPDDIAGPLRRHLPWTRIFGERRVTVAEKTVDLPAFAVAERASLALKPNGEYGGKGVVLGWESTPGEWEDALSAALLAEQPYVLQLRVPVTSEPYPLVAGGELRVEARLMDVDPYCHRGEIVSGAGVRLGTGGILNVTAGGGSAVPLFL
ncbi:MAG TPA: hypothetical protein VER55_12455 [Ardenticatenaceae bacterium]|nr:hypothetical protein [Ardenticatenaceae bacterium]